MHTFEALPTRRSRRDFPAPGFSYLDVEKVRALVLPIINKNPDTYRTINQFCHVVMANHRIKMYQILYRPDTFWSDASIARLAHYLEVDPKDIKAPAPSPFLKTEWCNSRPQDFIHDHFQGLVTEELKGKRLNASEYNEWLGALVGASARTIYNLQNGTANPSQDLVMKIARHFNRPITEFYRA